jgi:type I restriction enzyme R subunit
VNQTKEAAFESYVETMLLGDTVGWQRGALGDWDVEKALFPAEVCGFIEDSQPKLWQQMRSLHGANLESLLIDALAKELDLKGSLQVLRHGFKFYGKTFRLAYFEPAHGLSYEVLNLYTKNRLTITRQVPCYAGKRDTTDLVFAVNGVPVATCELKNPNTGQTWRNAVNQYKQDRDPRGSRLLEFKKRALVHFAADPDEVHMTTKLQANRRTSCPSIAAATRAPSNAVTAIHHTPPVIARATSGKRSCNARASWTSSAASCSSRSMTRRSTTGTAASVA